MLLLQLETVQSPEELIDLLNLNNVIDFDSEYWKEPMLDVIIYDKVDETICGASSFSTTKRENVKIINEIRAQNGLEPINLEDYYN